jgi:hypothetical protein
MPRYRIRMINSEFESLEEGDYPSLEAARRMAIATAARVACESIAAGETAASVEIEIHDGDAFAARNVVTLSVADLSGAATPGQRA